MKFGTIVSMISIITAFEEFILASDFTVAVLQGEQALLPCILPPDLDHNVTESGRRKRIQQLVRNIGATKKPKKQKLMGKDTHLENPKKVTWYYWEQELSVGDNVTVEDERFTLYRPYQSDWYLRISDTLLKDRGRYRCVVEDSEFTSIATLVVESPPSVVGYQSDEVFIQICYKARLTLYCNVTGLPRPIITWYKLDNQNQPVPIMSDLEIYEERIFIPEVDDTSPGVFMCKVKNTHGKTKMKFHVEVIDLMTIIEPVRKSEVPRQIVHSRVLTSSNAQESVHLGVHLMTLHSFLYTVLHMLFVRTVP